MAPIKNNINKSTLTAKSLKKRAQTEAKKLIDNARAQAMFLEADAIESVKGKLENVVEEIKEKIDKEVKAQTGCTIQEIRYQSIQVFKAAKDSFKDGKEKVNEWKNKREEKKRKKAEKNGEEYEAPKDTSMQVKKPSDLNELVKKMPDSLYNAFFLAEIFDLVEQAETIVAQTTALGKEAIDEISNQIKFIQDNFKKGDKLDSEDKKSDTESVKSSIDLDTDSYSNDTPSGGYMASSEKKEVDVTKLNVSLLAELGKSKASTSGKDYDFSDKKKTSEIANKAIDFLNTVLPLLVLFQHLIINYNTNKESLRNGSASRLSDILKHNNEGKKRQEIPAKEVFDQVLDRIPGLRDDYDEDQEIDDGSVYFYDNPTIEATGDSPVAYIADEPELYSELDRLRCSLSLAIKNCKYNPEYELYSESTKTNGGKVVNLRHAGNNKDELVDAIEALNGGKRL